MAGQHKRLAETFIRKFCSGDYESLVPLLETDVRVSGPVGSYSSRDEYMAALRNDPPMPGTHTLLEVTEANGQIVVTYEYARSGERLLITQSFAFRHERIARMELDFRNASPAE